MKKILFVAILSLFFVPSLIFAADPVIAPPVATCNFTSNLTVGSTDSATSGQVSKLQSYLVSKGKLTIPSGVSMGYFGVLTRTALAAYQTSVNITPAAGYFGSITRAYINSHCGSTSGVSISSISPNSASIGTQVTVNGSGFTATGNTVKLDNSFALKNLNSSDGHSIVFTLLPAEGYCPNVGGAICPPIYSVPPPLGTHQLSIINSNGTSNSLNFTVVYNNVSISTISPLSGPAGTQVTINGQGFSSSTPYYVKFSGTSSVAYMSASTFMNSLLPCAMNVSCPASFYLKFNVPSSFYSPCFQSVPLAQRQNNTACIPISNPPPTPPGMYSLSVANVDGNVISNAVSFIVTSTSTSNGVPVISGVSAPTTLAVNQTGTWTVSASDPQNGQLSYGVDWGDSQCSSGSGCTTSGSNPSSIPSFQQTTSFTHQYSQVGVFTQTFKVKNSTGGEASASTTVRVGNTASSTLPQLNSIAPTSGAIGTEVTITGSNFTSAGNLIKFGNSADITVHSANGTTIKFTIPGNLSTCGSESCTNVYQPVTGGSYQLSVTNSKGSSNSITLNVTSL